jgi:hypothetical protein
MIVWLKQAMNALQLSHQFVLKYVEMDTTSVILNVMTVMLSVEMGNLLII